jgi:hypothetical protein
MGSPTPFFESLRDYSHYGDQTDWVSLAKVIRFLMIIKGKKSVFHGKLTFNFYIKL